MRDINHCPPSFQKTDIKRLIYTNYQTRSFIRISTYIYPPPILFITTRPSSHLTRGGGCYVVFYSTILSIHFYNCVHFKTSTRCFILKEVIGKILIDFSVRAYTFCLYHFDLNYCYRNIRGNCQN